MITGARTSVDLLEQAIGYTRDILTDISEIDLARPTPCNQWRLEDLLTHMDDALTAFTEAAVGSIALSPAWIERAGLLPEQPGLIERLRSNACLLLSVWAVRSAVPDINVGMVTVPGDVLLNTAAIEVSVHGWDIERTIIAGRHTQPRRIPEDLALQLLDAAHNVITDADRGRRFAAELTVSPLAPADERLLAFLGRQTDLPVV